MINCKELSSGAGNSWSSARSGLLTAAFFLAYFEWRFMICGAIYGSLKFVHFINGMRKHIGLIEAVIYCLFLRQDADGIRLLTVAITPPP